MKFFYFHLFILFFYSSSEIIPITSTKFLWTVFLLSKAKNSGG